MGMKCIGVDVGGTSVKIGLFEITGELLDKWEVKTRKEEGGTHILPDVARSIRARMEERGLSLKTDLVGIGLGVPGPVMPDGFVEVCVNLGWRRMNPQEELSRLLDGVTVKSGNDANVAALGEMWQGGGKGYKDLVMITLGTGIGGGIIIDKKLYRGKSGNANILGHLLLHSGGRLCTCGRKGCWEAYASVTAFIRMAGEAADQNRDSLLWQLRNEEDLDGKNIFTAVKKKDPAALRMFDQYTGYLAEGITDIVNMLEPEAVIIGGGISREGDLLLDPVRRMVARNIYCGAAAMPVITAARLGNDAGIIGAACLDQY